MDICGGTIFFLFVDLCTIWHGFPARPSGGPGTGRLSRDVGLIPGVSSFFTTALALCLFGLGFGLTQPLSMVMVADLSDPEHPGLSMGIRFTVISLANLLGPVLLGFLVEDV
ncbi:conserved hypothetical protein [delta proteobacterium NaphS2]|nr:conserved hypothetical protein [delta proteobacterium NaphS2]